MKAELRWYGESKSIDVENHPTLLLKMSDGGEIGIELFERTSGRLVIRTNEGSIIVHPHVTNVIEVEAEYKRRRK